MLAKSAAIVLVLAAGACRSARVVDADLAIVNVTVLPMTSEASLEGRTVLVKDGTIVAVGPASDLACDATCTVVDGAGKYLIPGLADMHVHVWSETELPLYVANGVTLVRNMWGEPTTLAMRKRVEAGEILGPRIVTAGRLVDGDPPLWGAASGVATTPEQARTMMDEQKAAGYDFFKVYTNLSLEVFDAIAAHAREIGFRFAGHVPRAVPLEHALESGMASIEHLTGWGEATRRPDGPFPSDAAYPDWTKRGVAAAALARRLKAGEVRWDDVYDPERRQALAAKAAAQKVWQVPTLVVNRRIHTSRRQAAAELARPEMRYMAPDVRASWNPASDFRMKVLSDDDQEALQLFREEDQRRVKALADAGAGILAGTDAPNPFVVHGFAIHEELADLVAAGLTPYQALVAATRAPAEFLDETAKAGTVEVGKRADLVLLDADPLKDIAASSAIAGVALRGRWLPRAEIDGILKKIADGYAPNADWFEDLPPLPDDASTAELSLFYNDVEIGAERHETTIVHGRAMEVGERRLKTSGELSTETVTYWPATNGLPEQLTYELKTPSGSADGEVTVEGARVSLSGRSVDGTAVARSYPKERSILGCDLVTCLSPVGDALARLAVGGRREFSVLALESLGDLRLERETWTFTRRPDADGARVYEGAKRRGGEETGLRLVVGPDGVASYRQTLKIGTFEARPKHP